ncbi:MAG: TlyA family RNA methyltransferase [Chloroflexi bacterium]|nr:TlyA family RNA methyltransferase [Chloroflexota bacterium]
MAARAQTQSQRSRQRLDALLVARGLAPSRERARALVLARSVLVDGVPALRAGASVDAGVALALREQPRYASRSGEKLRDALVRSGLAALIPGRRCLDIGASTGGFTDCLLQHGAASVVAVDVGYGQLAVAVRADPRVEVRERTNARTLAPLDPPVGLVTIDVSFISLALVLPAAVASLRPGGDVLALVKPQFEAGRAEVGRGGVVRDPAVQAACVGRVARWAVEHGLRVRGVYRSPLPGPAGNLEFFLWLRRPA